MSEFTVLETTDIATGKLFTLALSDINIDTYVESVAESRNISVSDAWKLLWDGQSIVTQGYRRRLR